MQCVNFRNFLPLKFSVKSILEVPKTEALNFDSKIILLELFYFPKSPHCGFNPLCSRNRVFLVSRRDLLNSDTNSADWLLCPSTKVTKFFQFALKAARINMMEEILRFFRQTKCNSNYSLCLTNFSLNHLNFSESLRSYYSVLKLS